jgi:hypothetical protein
LTFLTPTLSMAMFRWSTLLWISTIGAVEVVDELDGSIEVMTDASLTTLCCFNLFYMLNETAVWRG